MPRFDPHTEALRVELAEEERVLKRIESVIQNWKDSDTIRPQTHYECAHFSGIGRDDYVRTKYRIEQRIEGLKHRIAEAERDPELIY